MAKNEERQDQAGMFTGTSRAATVVWWTVSIAVAVPVLAFAMGAVAG